MGLVNRVIGLILAFVLLLLIPLIQSSIARDTKSQRVELNSLNWYIDVVTDKGLITQDDYEDFVNRLSATGYMYKVVVEVEDRRVYAPVAGAPAQSLDVKHVVNYIASSEKGGVVSTKVLSMGDILNVTIEMLESRQSENILSSVLDFQINPSVLTMSGMVRNDG